MKVLPLIGPKALKAFYAFNALLMGVKQLPDRIGQSYESFFEEFRDKTEAEKETVLRLAAAFVNIQEDELEALICFTTDKNGVPYSKVNLKNLGIKELHEIIVAVGMEIGRIDIMLVSSEEKKNSPDSP